MIGMRILKIPNSPRATSKSDDTIMAPWISLILTCQSSVFIWDVMLAISSGAGHFQIGRLKIAKVDATMENDPP